MADLRNNDVRNLQKIGGGGQVFAEIVKRRGLSLALNRRFSLVFINEIAKYDQELDYLGPAEYGAWLRDQYAREKLVVERMGLSRNGS